ncbi:MAG: hypothetical protein ABIN89_09015 [Chitinophagaceae bacterium]
MLKIILVSLCLLCSGWLTAQVADLAKAEILVSSKIQSPFRETVIRVLQEEIMQRTSILLPPASTSMNTPVIVLATKNDDNIGGLLVPGDSRENVAGTKAEGFRIVLDKYKTKDVLWLIGADERGILFSIGKFLSTASLSKKKILFDKANEITTSPVYSIRGHQLGYRNTANSWDAWTVDQFDKYIRELALLGTNCIENIPFQGGPRSVLMKLPREEMNIRMSEICGNYGLDYWVWTPVDVALSDSSKFNAEVKKHAEFYKKCPRLDNVFVPGGDPGDNDPEYVMPFLKAIAAELKKYHPKAGVWVSLQGFSDRQVDYFYGYLEKNNPDWLAGVVSGPGSPELSSTRFRLPAKYKHRDYPDITHSVRCQYPVQEWDQAFALTEGREVCNPRPFFYAKIHHRFAQFTDGFISYSDGVHDDVNKVVWSQLGWDPDKNVNQIVKEYASCFFGSSVADDAANGIFALERNWVGPLEENGGIETSFAFWQKLESLHPELSGNWRWQQLVMRCYYDTYTRHRKIFEKGLEKNANSFLAAAGKIGSGKAMETVLAMVGKADTEPIFPELRQKIVDYCAALFKSIGMQTSVKKYNASGEERGAILDFLDYPLNNRWWLTDEFAMISKMPDEQQKLSRLEIIHTWENSGQGSYYDNVSDVSQSPHVKSRSEDATDVAWWDNGKSRKRLSTQLFQNFPRIEYEDLDPNGHYIIRIAGEGDALLRVDGERITPFTYNKELEQFKEFHIASKYVSDGKMIVSFDQPEESNLNWRKKSKVCDIWLLKQ